MLSFNSLFKVLALRFQLPYEQLWSLGFAVVPVYPVSLPAAYLAFAGRFEELTRSPFVILLYHMSIGTSMILLFCNKIVTFSCNLVLLLWFECALALCRAERMRSSANSFIVSAVRVFNTFNTFNRFSTKCCTMIFVILTNFQHFNKFSTKLSTLFFAFYLRFSVKF